MNILVTGGASGLGKSITHKLASDSNNQVYFTYHQSKVEAERIQSDYNNVQPIRCDFLNEEEVKKLCDKMTEMNLDVLINNAFVGKIEQQYFHKGELHLFENDFRRNILPTVAITQNAIKIFRKKKFGKIITILSSAILNKPPIGWSIYVANKSYLYALSKSWATENASFNVTSNCISPSFMKTELTSEMDERMIEEIEINHPLKALLTTEEVSETVKYFCSCSQQINGVNFIVNAGSDLI
jgi:NAD(P)-dependent dehydrogenase (short-subunit alcohol dehydrogenase family)